MSGSSRWFLPHHERTLAGHWVPVRRRHGGRSTVDGVAVTRCDLRAVNGLVHAVDEFLPSALRRHVHRGRARQRSDVWTILDRILH